MSQFIRRLFPLGLLALLAACSQPAPPANPLSVGTPAIQNTTIPTATPGETAVMPTPTSGLLSGESEKAYPSPTTEPAPAAAYPPPDAASAEVSTAPVQYSYRVVNRYPHDPNAFTQGLIYRDGVLYEGTGRYGQSSLRRVDLDSGEVAQMVSLNEQYFGEGITIFGDKIYQLTWKANTGFVYDRDSFEPIGTFTYPTQGWGLTHDDEQLIMSDGSNTLYFLDPETLAIVDSIPVLDQTSPVVRLNELEYIEGDIFANVWQTNLIARIDPETGQVTGWLDLTGILADEALTQPVDVLNGIAYDAENGRLFVTGKLWPALFEIELVETAVSDPYP